MDKTTCPWGLGANGGTAPDEDCVLKQMTGKKSTKYIGAQVLEALAEYISQDWDDGQKRPIKRKTFHGDQVITKKGVRQSYNGTKEVYEIPMAYWDSYGKDSVYKDFTVIVTQNTDLLHWREWVDQQAARWVGRGANIHFFNFNNWDVRIFSSVKSYEPIHFA